jgi:hypothetical protein
MASKPRHYIVTMRSGDGRARLVKAHSADKALAHVVADTLDVEYATQEDLIALMLAHPGTAAEDATATGQNPSTN